MPHVLAVPDRGACGNPRGNGPSRRPRRRARVGNAARDWRNRGRGGRHGGRGRVPAGSAWFGRLRDGHHRADRHDRRTRHRERRACRNGRGQRLRDELPHRGRTVRGGVLSRRFRRSWTVCRERPARGTVGPRRHPGNVVPAAGAHSGRTGSGGAEHPLGNLRTHPSDHAGRGRFPPRRGS